MRLQLALMPKNEETRGLLEDVTIMAKITESFMAHAAESSREPFVHRNLAIFLEKIAKSFDFPIKIEGDKAIEIFVKPLSFKRLLTNIISNAEKHASELYISFYKNENNIVINLEDNGSGIAPDILGNVFSPFFTKSFPTKNTAKNSAPNVGLGLSIARDIMLDHGGQIKASNSSKYPGAQFTLIFKNN